MLWGVLRLKISVAILADCFLDSLTFGVAAISVHSNSNGAFARRQMGKAPEEAVCVVQAQLLYAEWVTITTSRAAAEAATADERLCRSAKRLPGTYDAVWQKTAHGPEMQRLQRV